MIQSLRVAVVCCFFPPVWTTPAFAAEPPPATQPISHRDIGWKYHIVGEFGPLFTDFTIKGVVIEAPEKRDKSEDGKTVWLDISDINGKALEMLRTQKVFSNSKFVMGSQVELVVREEAELWKAEGIDAMLSNPVASHLGKVLCALSIHERQVVKNTLPPQPAAAPSVQDKNEPERPRK